ncbi:Pimeloyl-ACP methyl ester carboxylesterase [Bryocella elongata]|uniref:Pimeloyl-ACP methyl ester carboxylesterase n=1 Tax=Bryocella elongata TaxID=863522 RepID=A0A1H6BXY1_9BACT|nr:alpha/beta hydrolase [Bryocella elongata]SEG65512.1 Pimeloyl-ACP methyl ester carboxylesterase [Bryocella elongata]
MTKFLQILATIAFVVGGIMLLCAPAPAQTAVVMKASSGEFTPTRFTVVDEGKAGAPDVVLIPGLSSSRAVWDAEAKLLAPNYRLHLVQVNGFAGQAAGPNATGEILPAIVDELHGYIAAAGMHPVVMGHSLGGLLTLMLAARYPGDVRKLVIVDTLPFYALLFGSQATVETVRPQAEAMKQQMLSIPDEQLAMVAPMMAHQLVKDADGAKIVGAWSVSSDRKVVANAMVEDMLTDMRPVLGSIKTPALVLYEHDPTLTMPNADRYEALMKSSYQPMPNATLVRVDDSRHFIMYDQPAKFDAVVEGFLK